MDRPDLPRPRKRPKQARSLLLVRAIEEACLKILQEEGPEQLSTQRIADVAGINIASLYQYFPNKEAVLAEVFEDRVRQFAQAARERFAEIDRLSRTSLEDTLAAIVEMEFDQRVVLLRMDPQFYRAYQHSFDIHRQINDLTIALNNPGWDEWFPRFLARYADRLRSRDVELLSRVVSHALAGLLLSTVAEEPELLEQDAYKEEVVTLLLAYLCK